MIEVLTLDEKLKPSLKLAQTRPSSSILYPLDPNTPTKYGLFAGQFRIVKWTVGDFVGALVGNDGEWVGVEPVGASVGVDSDGGFVGEEPDGDNDGVIEGE